MKIELDEYERDNLYSMMLGLDGRHDTGDWFHQILYKLECIQADPFSANERPSFHSEDQ